MKISFVLFLTIAALMLMVTPAVPAAPPDEADTWSKPVNGVQARITLVQKTKASGTLFLFPYLELRNVTDVGGSLMIPCDNIQFELIEADGKTVRDGHTLPRGGVHVPLGTIGLPWDSTLRMNMVCSNWGVTPNQPAMIATDSGAWVLKAEDKGKVKLRAIIKHEIKERNTERI